jgi:O-antigen ligase
MNTTRNQISDSVVILALVIITLFVTPFYSYDPINTPRFVSTTIFGFISFLLFLTYKKTFRQKRFQPVLLICVGFIIWSSISSLSSKMNLQDTLFGISGRQTGLITYLSLIFLMLLTIIRSQSNLQLLTIKVLLYCGLISTLYGLIQSFGYDPLDWINSFNPVFGFFGNPNFQASFLGISASASIAYILQGKLSKLARITWMLYIPLSLYVVYQSQSQQGFLVFAAGASTVIYIWIHTHKRFVKLRLLYLLAWVLGVFLVLLDIFQRSPWQPILYKPSVTFRGDFWRTGWEITKDNAIFGVGLDGYRDNYRFYRDQIAAERNPTSIVDSSHNVFLDISSGGGLPLLLIYIALILLVIISILRIIKRETEFNFGFAGVIGAWVAYLSQSIISINQIGLAIWGWVLSGAIIGYEINTREGANGSILNGIRGEKLAIGVGIILGLMITLPVLISDGQFRSSIKQGDVLKIEKNLNNWPQSVTRMNTAAQIFIEGGFADRALVISQKAIEINPRNYEAWEKIYLNPVAGINIKNLAFQKMKELDPLNPTLK